MRVYMCACIRLYLVSVRCLGGVSEKHKQMQLTGQVIWEGSRQTMFLPAGLLRVFTGQNNGHLQDGAGHSAS
jgi:hypothetical protein